MTTRTFGGSPLMNVMTKAAEKAARGLLRDFGELEHLQVSKKSMGDFVTSADKRSESILIEELEKARPDFGILTEESGHIKPSTSESTFIIDPLDGTNNFLHAIPHFAINIAVEKGGYVVAAITYDPIKDEMFWAEKGKGAFLNQRRLRVSGRTEMDTCLLSMNIPNITHGGTEMFDKIYKNVVPRVSGVRRSGSVALDLAYVAAGRYDILMESHCKPWDIASGILMIKEASGQITSLDGKSISTDSQNVCAANLSIHKDVLNFIKV